jgi:methyl-accepting chemotaxis protein
MRIKTDNIWLIIGVLLIVTIGCICEHLIESEAKKDAIKELNLFLTLRKASLEEYFASVATEINSASNNHLLPAATQSLSAFWNALSMTEREQLSHKIKSKEPVTADAHTNKYLKEYLAFEDYAKRFIRHFGYYDIFLISPSGDVVYSYAKEDDFGSNLLQGTYSNTSLADVFKQAIKNVSDDVVISDYKRYKASNNAPAMFCAHAVIKDGKVVGVLALQVPTELINNTMKFSAGMGLTGETYVVGQDLLMRSQSRFSKSETVLKTEVNTKTVKLALQGKVGQMITQDYRGITVFSAYSPVNFNTNTWAILAEKDVAEVTDPIKKWWLKAVLLALLCFGILYYLLNKLTKR